MLIWRWNGYVLVVEDISKQDNKLPEKVKPVSHLSTHSLNTRGSIPGQTIDTVMEELMKRIGYEVGVANADIKVTVDSDIQTVIDRITVLENA